MVDWLQERGYPVGPKRVRRMFRLMGHETIYRRKNLTKGALKAYIKPYLLRGLKSSVQIKCGARLLRIFLWQEALCT
jgi:hypothetical protein